MSSTSTIELRAASPVETSYNHTPLNENKDQSRAPASEESSDPTTQVPDGGYGWVIVSCCSLFTFHFNGLNGSWGILQNHLLEKHLPSVPTYTIAFVGSFALATEVAFGVLSARLVSWVGFRTAAIAGVLILGLSEILSGFATSSVGGLFGTSGLMAGIGICVLYSISNSLPAQYFSSHLGTANGVVKLGGGVGATALAVVLEYLIQAVGVSWTFRILGFITLATGLPTALLIKERSHGRSAAFLDLSLFRDPVYTAISIAAALGTFTLFAPPYFLPFVATSLGFSSGTGAGLVAGFNACTAVGRLLSGPACDKLGAINTFFLVMALNALSMLAIWPFSDSLALLTVFSILNGVANGSFFTTMPTAIATMVGPEKAAVAMGQACTGWTVGYLMGAPIAGFLLQATNADRSSSIDPYRPAIFYAGSLAAASCLFALAARFAKDRALRKKI
ncbi:MFS general substrate transporter [Hortaea werneckii]|nr:MFS general substrate transporter [Hortaea werneckii]